MALTGRFNAASRGQDLSGLPQRRNVLMQAKDEWPRATSGGLGMEIVEKFPSGVAKYKLVHNSAYKDVQHQFDICVESMEPERMIELLRFNRESFMSYNPQRDNILTALKHTTYLPCCRCLKSPSTKVTMPSPVTSLKGHYLTSVDPSTHPLENV